MNAHRSCWLVLTAALLASSARAAVDVHLSTTSHTEGAAGAQNVPQDAHDTVDATLGDTWMIVRRGASTSYFDFARRRRTEIDERRHTRVDYSLFDAVGFRVMELANRLALSRMMSAAKLPQQTFDPIEAEQALSVQDKPGSPLQVTIDVGDTVFSAGTRTLARVSTQATPVPPVQARLFAQLVRYTWGGHPQILAALAQSDAIPATLTLTTIGIGTTTLTLQIASVRPSDAGPIDIATIPLQPVPTMQPEAVDTPPPPREGDEQRGIATSARVQPPLSRVLARGAAVTDAEIAAARQRVQARVDADFRDDRPFDAYLGMIEWVLTSGETALPLDAVRTAAVNADPAVVALRAALAPRPKAGMQEAIDQLEALRPRTRTQGELLDLFIANDRATLGDRQAARNGLVAVLLARPYIAGAYKDLGDNLLLSFDGPDAWRCWDIGRRIAPHLSTFQAINEFENRLATLHPEYF